MSENRNERACARGSVGGQAVVEGVMMRSPEYTAIAVRRMDNKKISVKRTGNSSLGDKHKIFKLPIIRGVVNFIESMKLSFSTITAATDMLGIDTAEEEQSKFDKWLEKHFGKWIMPVVTALSLVLGVALSVALFIFLPTFIGKLIFPESVSGFGGGALRSVIEGFLKIVIFILYIWLTALIPDMKRVYMYHGAEHKSIFCYESGLELNIENVRKQSRFHPRCGTSFMFAMILLSVFIGIAFLWWVDIVWLRSVLKLALLPLTCGIGYEFIRYAGRHDNALVHVLSAPGLWMQRLTTREPDDSMIEVGIASLKCCIPKDFPGYYEELSAEAEAVDAASSEIPEDVPNEEKAEGEGEIEA